MSKGSGIKRPNGYKDGYGRGFKGNADLFHSRGAAWPEAERAKHFNRHDYENPDLDRYTRASRSDREFEGVVMDIKRINIQQRNESADEKTARLEKQAKEIKRRKLASIAIRMHKKMRGEIK